MASVKSTKSFDTKYIFLILGVLVIIGIVIFFVWKTTHHSKGAVSNETLKLVKYVQENWTFDNSAVSENYGDLVQLETDYKTNYYSDIDNYNKAFEEAQANFKIFNDLYNALTSTGGTIPNIDEIKNKIDKEVVDINGLLGVSEPPTSFQVLYDKTKALNEDLAKISPLIGPAIEGATKAQDAGQKAIDSYDVVEKYTKQIEETQNAGKNILLTFKNSTPYKNIQTLISDADKTLALIAESITKTAEDVDKTLLETAQTKVEAIKAQLQQKIIDIEKILTHEEDITIDIPGRMNYIQGKIIYLTQKKEDLSTIDTNKIKLQTDITERLKDLGLLQNVFDYGNQIDTQYGNINTFLSDLQKIPQQNITPIPIPSS